MPSTPSPLPPPCAPKTLPEKGQSTQINNPRPNPETPFSLPNQTPEALTASYSLFTHHPLHAYLPHPLSTLSTAPGSAQVLGDTQALLRGLIREVYLRE
jgi:hypothetical protein